MLHPLWPLTVSGVTPKDQEEEEEEGEEEEPLALPLPDDEPAADAADAADDAADTVHGAAEERFPPDFASTPVPDAEEEEKTLAVPLPDDEGVADAADAADAAKSAADAGDAAEGAADAANAGEDAANAAEEILAGHPPDLVSTSASSGSTSSVYYTAESGTSSGSASSQYVTAESGSEAEEVRLEFSGFESVSDLCPRYNHSFLTTNCNRRWTRGA